VADNLRYAGYVKNARGARYALAHQKGDCTEFMALFVALCRADRIPARGIGGYVLKNSSIVKPAGYHNWAEFYHDGVWHAVDPQNNVFMPSLTEYIAMRIIGDPANSSLPAFSRFGFKGHGLAVRMN
jgi:transglutaminase-like putative cysteine protease